VLLIIFGLVSVFFYGQERTNNEYETNYIIGKDPSKEGQWAFVQELLYTAGFMPESVQIYQTLPNNSRVYRVNIDSITGGFLFVRWDAKKKEHYVANKMINPGWYYNLKAAREIMRKQTNKANFTKDDMALQAQDQIPITNAELVELRKTFSEKEFTKDSIEQENRRQSLLKQEKKLERKEKKKD
tara:strand:+ start:3611 stop:4165 length:555 start_codon:yes stop_codon:yes gene_type:complete